MMKLLAVVIGVLGTALAVWLGGWVLFVGGIVQAIEGVTADPVSGSDIGMGILRVIFASAVGWITFLVMIFLATLVWSESNLAKRRRRGRIYGP